MEQKIFTELRPLYVTTKKALSKAKKNKRNIMPAAAGIGTA